MSKNKKNILFIIIGLSLIVIGGWIYFFFIKNEGEGGPIVIIDTVSPSTQPTQTPPSPQPTYTQGTQRFDLLSAESLLGPTVNTTSILFFDRTKGTFQSLLLSLGNKKATAISETKFEGNSIKYIEWSLDKTAVIIRHTDYNQTTIFSVYKIPQNLLYTLPDYVLAATWSPDGKKIAVYRVDRAKNRYLISTMDPDGSNVKELLNIHISNIELMWPSMDTLYFYDKPMQSKAIDGLFKYSFPTKQLGPLNIFSLAFGEDNSSSFHGITLFPSPDGKIIFFSYTNLSGTSLLSGIVNPSAINEEAYLIDVPFSSLPQKCSWAKTGETIYCAYSDEFRNSNKVVPFDYWNGSLSTNDSFARFNWKTGELKVYAEKTGFDATDVSVSPDESFLIFINRKDMNLYKMKL